MRKSGLTGDEAYILSKHEETSGDLGPLKKELSLLKEDLDNKIEHVDGYKEYDIGAPSVGTYWNKSAKKQLESETYQSFNPISLKAGTYHYENMSGFLLFMKILTEIGYRLVNIQRQVMVM